jgi:hypothetical protein
MINSEESDISTLIAACPHCKQIKPLEACIDCYQPMCSDCMKIHIEKWKEAASKFCKYIDIKIDKYLTKISKFKRQYIIFKFFQIFPKSFRQTSFCYWFFS